MDSIVEYEADKNQGHVVERHHGGNVTQTRKDDQEVDILEEFHFEPLVHYPLN